MVIADSIIPGAGLAIKAAQDLPKKMKFGPYGGGRHRDFLKAHDGGKAWTVLLDII